MERDAAVAKARGAAGRKRRRAFRCSKCGVAGHRHAECPQKHAAAACFACGKSGHKKADCPDAPRPRGAAGAGHVTTVSDKTDAAAAASASAKAAAKKLRKQQRRAERARQAVVGVALGANTSPLDGSAHTASSQEGSVPSSNVGQAPSGANAAPLGDRPPPAKKTKKRAGTTRQGGDLPSAFADRTDGLSGRTRGDSGSRKPRRGSGDGLSRGDARDGGGGGGGDGGGGANDDKLWHPFDADYCDHFATSQRAVADVAPVIRLFGEQAGHKTVQNRAPGTQPPLSNTVAIYDPYYCDGAIRGILHALGFPHVRHENVDFYQHVADGTTPPHDVVVSNPPYSEDHKVRCMQYCVADRRPWMLAMPVYVAKKAWWKAAIAQLPFPPVYLVPKKKYEYNHPEGTGHATSPFDSCWFIGGVQTATHAAQLTACLRTLCTDPRRNLRFAASLQELDRDLNVVDTRKRPNPKQRRKRSKLFAKKKKKTKQPKQ